MSSEPQPAPRPRSATSGDLGPISTSLAAAFADDPVWEWLLPTGRNGGPGAVRIFRWLTALQLRHRSVWTLPDAAATAVWAPPGNRRPPTPEVLRALPGLVGALGVRGLVRLAKLGELERLHPPEPHWYLALLGTHPEYQGLGLGTAAVAPGILAADHEGLGCYLESSKEANLAFYHRLGFAVVGIHDVGGGSGPRLWRMWREPR